MSSAPPLPKQAPHGLVLPYQGKAAPGAQPTPREITLQREKPTCLGACLKAKHARSARAPAPLKLQEPARSGVQYA